MLEAQKYIIPSIIEKSSEEFRQDLEEFYSDTRNHPGPYPKIFGEVIDLKSLYLKVQNYGGSNHVTLTNKWKEIALSFGVKYNTSNVSNAFKDIYTRFLEPYERSQNSDFRSDDRLGNQDTPSSSSATKSYSQVASKRFRFTRMVDELLEIEKQLISGFDNEIDFSLNSLLIMSASKKEPLRLSNNSRLPLILLEIIGFCNCDHSFIHRKANFQHYWKRILSVKGFDFRHSLSLSDKDLSSSPANISSQTPLDHTDDDFELFKHRTHQILLIFRNLILEDFHHECIYLGRFPCLTRFLLACFYSVSEEISNSSLEALCNLSVPLGTSQLEDLFLHLINDLLSSPNRKHIKSAHQIITNLSQCPIHINSNISTCIYVHRQDRNLSFYTKLITDQLIMDKIVQGLCIPDVSIMISCLDAVFSISCKGRTACQKMILHDLWHYLKYLLTIKTQSLCKSSTLGISFYQGPCRHPVYRFANYSKDDHMYDLSLERVDRKQKHYGNIMHAPMPPRPSIPIPVYDEETVIPHPKNSSLSNGSVNGHHSHKSADAFLQDWLSRNFTPDHGSSCLKTRIYSDYRLAHQMRMPSVSPLPMNDFIKLLKSTLGVDEETSPQQTQFFHLKRIQDGDQSSSCSSDNEIDLKANVKRQRLSSAENRLTKVEASMTNGYEMRNGFTDQYHNNNNTSKCQIVSTNGTSTTLPYQKNGHALPMNKSMNDLPIKINGNYHCSNGSKDEMARGDANNNEANKLTLKSDSVMAYPCKWSSCWNRSDVGNLIFENANQLSSHVYNSHFLSIKDEKIIFCPWQGCIDHSVKRTPNSLLSHLSDRHYKPERIDVKGQVEVKPLVVNGLCDYENGRKNNSSCQPNHSCSNMKSSSNSFLNSTKHLFINRANNTFVDMAAESSNVVTTRHFNKTSKIPPQDPNKLFVLNTTGRDFHHASNNNSTQKSDLPSTSVTQRQNESEGPVTKHIRHTSLLILRNLLRHCPNFLKSKNAMLEELLCTIISYQTDSIDIASECISLLLQT